MQPRSRKGKKNPHWKGGISSLKTADQLLTMPQRARDVIRQKLLSTHTKDHKTGCWNWTGSTFSFTGYACLCLGTRHLSARLSYVTFRGCIGTSLVLHRCDNRLCINPDHLFLGTNADNSKDMKDKGRSLYGEKNHAAKLTEEDVLRIRELMKQGIKPTVIAREYGVTSTTIYYIRNGKSWSYLSANVS